MINDNIFFNINKGTNIFSKKKYRSINTFQHRILFFIFHLKENYLKIFQFFYLFFSDLYASIQKKTIMLFYQQRPNFSWKIEHFKFTS